MRVNAIAPVARTRLTEQVAGDAMNAEGRRVRPLRAREHLGRRRLARVGPVGRRQRPGREGAWAARSSSLRGWRPVTESTDEKPWTITAIDEVADALFAKDEKGVPPFMPEVQP